VRKVLYIADDLGAGDMVNDAVFHAHLHGALDGAGLMMGQPATDSAVARARETPTLEIGWHLHLLDSRPCTVESWPWGRSPPRAGFALACSPRMRQLVRDEIAAQWEAYSATGLPCRFVSSHHHLHVHPFVRRVLEQTLPPDFEGWIRWGEPRFFAERGRNRLYGSLYRLFQAPVRWPFAVSTTLWGLDRVEAMDATEVAAVLPTLGDGLHEFMFHPRRLGTDADLRCLLSLSRPNR